MRPFQLSAAAVLVNLASHSCRALIGAAGWRSTAASRWTRRDRGAVDRSPSPGRADDCQRHHQWHADTGRARTRGRGNHRYRVGRGPRTGRLRRGIGGLPDSVLGQPGRCAATRHRDTRRTRARAQRRRSRRGRQCREWNPRQPRVSPSGHGADTDEDAQRRDATHRQPQNHAPRFPSAACEQRSDRQLQCGQPIIGS